MSPPSFCPSANSSYGGAAILDGHIQYLKAEIPQAAADAGRSILDSNQEVNFKTAGVIAAISIGTIINIFGGVRDIH